MITQGATISFFFLLLHLSASPTTATITTINLDDHYQSPSPSTLVDGVCKSLTSKSSSYTDCVAAFALDPGTPSAPDAKALAKIALGLAVANTTKSKEYIENVARTNSSGSLKAALEFCVKQYEASVVSFNSALVEIDEDPLTANYDSKVASDGANNCENELKSKGFHDPSVTTRNNYVILYSDIGFAITNML